MRITLIGTAYPMRGGMAHYLALLYTRLKGRGHQVDIISFKRQYPRIFFPGTTQLDSSTITDPVPADPIIDSIGLVSWVRAVRALRKGNPDLIVFIYWMPFFLISYGAIAFLSRIFVKARILFICHNIIPHETKPGDGVLSRVGLSLPDAFLFHSKAVSEDLDRFRKNVPKRTVPLPVFDVFPEVPENQLQNGIQTAPSSRRVLFFGHVREYKGLHLLLEAMKLLPEEERPYLITAGEFYEPEAGYREKIKDLGLRDWVELNNRYIPNEEVGRFFQTTDLVVLPYVTATQSGILQMAYHFNKPVIITDVGGLPDFVEHGGTGYVIPPNDPAAIAHAMLRFYAERDTVDFAGNIRTYKKHFSWNTVAEAVEELGQ